MGDHTLPFTSRQRRSDLSTDTNVLYKYLLSSHAATAARNAGGQKSLDQRHARAAEASPMLQVQVEVVAQLVQHYPVLVTRFLPRQEVVVLDEEAWAKAAKERGVYFTFSVLHLFDR